MKRAAAVITAFIVLIVNSSAFSQDVVAGVDNSQKRDTVEMEGRNGLVESLSGTGALLRKGAQDWRDLEKGAVLQQGDQVSLGSAAEAVINIDGNKITVNGGTLFKLKTMTQQMDIKLWHGKMSAKIRKLSRGEQFDVLTPVASCSVKGTEFIVDVSGPAGETEVRTLEGKVSVRELQTGSEVMVEKGNSCKVLKGQDPIVSPVEHEDAGKVPAKEPSPASEPEAPAPALEEQPARSSAQRSSGPAAEQGFKLGPFTVVMNGSIGADVLADPDDSRKKKVYYSLSLMPEISIWKLGAGLDLNLYFDEDGNFRTEEWDGWNDVAAKVWYVRYARSGDPLYGYLGGIPGYTLGRGLILNRYTNMLDYPDKKNKGVILEVNTAKGGLEAMTSDIDSYPVFAGRVYYRPLYFTGIPVISGIDAGISGVLDQNPDMKDSTKDDDVLFYGADAGIPLLNIHNLTSEIYYQYATYELGDAYDNDRPGIGTSAGISGSLLKSIVYQAEYRDMDNNFEPGYFDTYYEVERATKPYTLGTGKEPAKTGPYAMLGVDLTGKFRAAASYEDYTNQVSFLHGNIDIDPALLMNRFTLSMSYDKKGVETWADLKKLEGAILTTDIGYLIASNVTLSVVQRQTFDENGNPDRTMSMHTRFSF